MRAWLTHGAALLAIGMLAGCGGQAGKPSASLQPVAGPQPSSAAAVGGMLDGIPPQLRIPPSPLQSYYVTARQKATLEYATDVLVGQCMTAKGFPYDAARFSDELAYWTMWKELRESRLYGLVNLKQVKVYGFGLPPMPRNPQAPNLDAHSHDGAWERARIGTMTAFVPGKSDPSSGGYTGGCLNDARNKIAGVGHIDVVMNPLAESLSIEANNRAFASPAWLEVQRDWATCMNARGYDIENPMKAGESPLYKSVIKHHDGKAADPAEVQLAVAAVECEVKVDQAHRESAIEDAAERKLLDQNQLALQQQHRVIDQAVQTAVNLTQGTTSGG